MWKVSIQSVAADQTASVARVEYKYYNDDGREKIVVERISEPSSIKQIAINGLRELERIDAVKEFIAKPPLGEISLVKENPTKEELAKVTYEQKRMELIRLKEDLDLGLIDQKVYDEALLAIKQ